MRLGAAFLSLCLVLASVPGAAAQEAARLTRALAPVRSVGPAVVALPSLGASSLPHPPEAAIGANAARDNAALLETLVSGAPTLLPARQYVTVVAQKLAQPRVVWANFSYLRALGLNVPAAGMTSDFEKTLLDAFAYGAPSDEEPAAAFSDEKKTFYADRYGGEGLGYNLGSGRAAASGSIQIKGIGRTPLVRDVDDHSNGFLGLEEALREAFWGEVNQELPFGANRVIAVIARGTDGPLKDDGTIEPNALVVRESPLRPAHFFPLPADFRLTAPIASPEESAANLARALAGTKPYENTADAILAGLGDYSVRVARQYAAAFARRLYHGAPSESNIELSGAFLDYGTQTALPGHGKLRVLDGISPAGDIRQIRKHQIGNTAREFLKKLPRETRIFLPGPGHFVFLFETAYRDALRRELLRLTGAPPEVIDRLAAKHSGLGELLIGVATRGGQKVLGKYSVPEKITRYDLGSLLSGLASLKPNGFRAVFSFLEKGGFIAGFGERLLMLRLARAYAAFMRDVVNEARQDGIDQGAAWTFMLLNAKNVNRDRSAAFRWKMMDENFAAIARAGNDLGRLQGDVDARVDRARTVFRAERPYEVVVEERRDAASGAVRRRVYDARRSEYRSQAGTEKDFERGRAAAEAVLRGLALVPQLDASKDLRDYRSPRGTALVMTSTRWASQLMLVGGALLTLAAYGPLAVSAAAALIWLWDKFYAPEKDADDSSGQLEFSPDQQRRLQERLDAVSAALTRRLGFSAEDSPWTRITNNQSRFGAWALGSGIHKGSITGWRASWAGRSDKVLGGIMAHEFAHLYFNDAGYGLAEPRLLMKVFYFFAGTSSISLMLWHLARHSPLFAHLPMPFLHGWPVACVPLAVSLIALFAPAVAAVGTRAMERRADHFGGWLTNPHWLARHFSHSLKERKEKPGFFTRVLSTHPQLESRVESLRRQAAERADEAR